MNTENSNSSQSINNSTRRRLAVATASVSLILAIAVPATVAVADQPPLHHPAVAQTTTRHVRGTLEATGLCSPPPGASGCVVLEHEGSISGPSKGVVISCPPSGYPGVAVCQGTEVIHTRSGDLSFAFVADINAAPSGSGEFAELDEITGGTGRYSGASGYVQQTGNLNLATGIGSGRYIGQLVTPG